MQWFRASSIPHLYVQIGSVTQKPWYCQIIHVKVYLQIASADNAARLQYALDLITSWANEWQLRLSSAKRNSVIHCRLVNPK